MDQATLQRVRDLLATPSDADLNAVRDILRHAAEGTATGPAEATTEPPPPPWRLWQDGQLIAQDTETAIFELAHKIDGPCTIEAPLSGCRWDLHTPDLTGAGYLDTRDAEQ